jgi:hypothetical protein
VLETMRLVFPNSDQGVLGKGMCTEQEGRKSASIRKAKHRRAGLLHLPRVRLH